MLLRAAPGRELLRGSCWSTTGPKTTPCGRCCAPGWPGSLAGWHWWARLEAEHAATGPLLAAVGAAAAGPGYDCQRLGVIVIGERAAALPRAG
jgi:hypothetical protein